MIYRLTIMFLSLWLLLSGTSNAVQSECPVAGANQIERTDMSAHADCDMALMPLADAMPTDDQTAPETAACCCPAILAALPETLAPERPATSFPAQFGTPLGQSPTSFPSVPEPPPPRA